jgi:hypothetical protein
MEDLSVWKKVKRKTIRPQNMAYGTNKHDKKLSSQGIFSKPIQVALKATTA